MINYKPPKPSEEEYSYSNGDYPSFDDDDKLCAFDILGVTLIVFFIVTMCFLPSILFN